MFSMLFYLCTLIFCQDLNEEYVCYQAGNSLCPENYVVYLEPKNLTDYLFDNINNQNTTFNIFIANDKQDPILLNCSLMPNNLKIFGFSDSYVFIDFQYSYNSENFKRNQYVTVSNLKVKSVRPENQNQLKIKGMFLNFINITFLNEDSLEIEADEISSTFNSLKRVKKLESEKLTKLSGLPIGINDEDLNLTVSIETGNLILESFNDDASIDFISGEEDEELFIFLKFNSCKNSLIKISSDVYNVNLDYDTQLSFYYNSLDKSSLKKLTDDISRVNIVANSKNAQVNFSDDKWPHSKILKHDDDDDDDDDESIYFNLACSLSVTISSSASYIPLTVNSCPNPHFVFNNLDASIDSLEMVNEGNVIIENEKNGSEVIFQDHVTFAPGVHLQVHESVLKARTAKVLSEFKTLPKQMTVKGHFEIDSSEFEFLEYSVSFEYCPFPESQTGRIHSFLVPANKERLMPIEIQNPSETIYIQLSNDFLTGEFNNFIKEETINRNILLFQKMSIEQHIKIILKSDNHSKNHHEFGWNKAQRKLVIIVQDDDGAKLKLNDLPSLYNDHLCLFKQGDVESKKLCEDNNLLPFEVLKADSDAYQKKVLESNSQDLYKCNIYQLTKLTEDIQVLASSSGLTLNFDNLESASVQSLNEDAKSSIIIDNTNNLIKSLSLKEISVSFLQPELKFDQLELGFGTSVDQINSVSFQNVNKLNVDVSILKDIPKNQVNDNLFVVGNQVEKIKFIRDGFQFFFVDENVITVEAKNYNEVDYPLIFNESNITLEKDYYKASSFTLPLHYSDFASNNYFIIIDDSFSNDNSELDIQLDGEFVRLLTYSTVIPIKFNNAKKIQIGLGQYDNIRAVDFSAPLKVTSELEVSIVSEKDSSLIDQKGIQIIFKNVELESGSKLYSGNNNIVFSEISVAEGATAYLYGVYGNGDIEIEGRNSFLNVLSDPATKKASNLGRSTFDVKMPEEIYDIYNSPLNMPLLNFDIVSIKHSVRLIKVTFEKYNQSLLSFNQDKIQLLSLVSVGEPNEEFDCANLASKVIFDDLVMNREPGEAIKLSASCANGIVGVYGEVLTNYHPSPSDEGRSDDDDDDGSGKMSKSKKIGLICGVGSAVIIIVVAVFVAIYLKRNYKEGDSDKAQMMVHLDPNGESMII